MSVNEVSKEQFKRLAGELRCEPEALMAVSHVEAPRGGFYDDGFPTILFERHKFYKHARRDKREEWSREYPKICNPSPTPRGGYGTLAAQRVKFSQAFALDPDAAMMACSWGAFQELGENYDDYGFDNVGEFVDMMKSGIEGQLEIFVRSIRKRGLVDELQRKDWAGFARNYNGAGYRRFEYDTQMSNAYRIFKAKKIDWDAIGLPPHFEESEIEQLTASIGPTSTATDPAGSHSSLPIEPASNTVELPEPKADGSPSAVGDGDPIGDAPDVPPSSWLSVEDWKEFCLRWLKRIWGVGVTGNIAQATAFVGAAVKDPERGHIYLGIGAVIFIIIAALGLLLSTGLVGLLWWNRKEIGHYISEQWRAKMDPTRKNYGLIFEKK